MADRMDMDLVPCQCFPREKLVKKWKNRQNRTLLPKSQSSDRTQPAVHGRWGKDSAVKGRQSVVVGPLESQVHFFLWRE